MQGCLARELRLASSRTRQVFLELFSGSGRIAAHIRKSGHAALEIDVRHGQHMDLLDRSVQKLVLGWVASGVVWGCWLGTPCTTWSVAHTTPVVRSKSFPWGVPGLASRHALAVNLGNATARFSFEVIKLCIRLRIPVCLENPASSRLWACPALTPLLSQAADVKTSAFCQYGERWRKLTRVAGWNTGTLDGLGKTCTGRRGLCSRTGLPHIQLNGRTQGISWTKIAEPYPAPWAAAAAHCLVHAAESLAMSRLLRLAAVTS